MRPEDQIPPSGAGWPPQGDEKDERGERPLLRAGLPWERRDQLGPGAALLGTIAAVIFSPTDAFRAMRSDGNWAEPLGFAILVGSVSLWAYELWGMVARTALVAAGVLAVEEATAANRAAVLSALLAPFFVCVLTVVLAGLVHLLVLIFAGTAKRFLPSFKVFCYSWSVGAFSIVPVCGIFAALLWLVIVWVKGLREAHAISTGQAAAPVLLVTLMACFCFMVLLIVAVSVGDLVPGTLQ